LSVYPSREEILANEEDAVKLLSSHRNWSEKKAREVIDSLKDHVEALNEEMKKFLEKFPDNPITCP